MRIQDISKYLEFCTGCAACVNICPKNAIAFSTDPYDKFFYPQINNEQCINCGLCVKVCSIEKKKDVWENGKWFEAYALDEKVRFNGSSGGVFGLISQEVITRGGSVYGAAYESEKKKVNHCSTKDIPLEAILRSKYVQSNINFTFRDIEEKLKEGEEILFCGTPCQVRGLKEYLSLKGVSGALITVDFMCHGVPSGSFLEEYIVQIEKKAKKKVINITFREKDCGWRTQVMKVYFDDQSIWKFKSLEHYYYYYYYFLNNYNLRKSCYTCDEYCYHIADITLADYWTVSPEKDDNKGISLIRTNTMQGENIILAIKNKAYVRAISSDQIDDKIYSHNSYNYNPRKRKHWMFVYNRFGIEGISTWYYYSVRMYKNIENFVRMSGGKIKKIIKSVKCLTGGKRKNEK